MIKPRKPKRKVVVMASDEEEPVYMSIREKVDPLRDKLFANIVKWWLKSQTCKMMMAITPTINRLIERSVRFVMKTKKRTQVGDDRKSDRSTLYSVTKQE